VEQFPYLKIHILN